MCFVAVSNFSIVNVVFLFTFSCFTRKVVSTAACNKQTRNPIVPSSVRAFKIHVSVINLVRSVNVFIQNLWLFRWTTNNNSFEQQMMLYSKAMTTKPFHAFHLFLKVSSFFPRFYLISEFSNSSDRNLVSYFFLSCVNNDKGILFIPCKNNNLLSVSVFANLIDIDESKLFSKPSKKYWHSLYISLCESMHATTISWTWRHKYDAWMWCEMAPIVHKKTSFTSNLQQFPLSLLNERMVWRDSQTPRIILRAHTSFDCEFSHINQWNYQTT